MTLAMLIVIYIGGFVVTYGGMLADCACFLPRPDNYHRWRSDLGFCFFYGLLPPAWTPSGEK